MRFRLILGLMLLVLASHQLFAFQIDKYLYANETPQQVQTQQIVVNNATYQIIYIKGKPAFLINGSSNQPISNATVIKEILEEYADEHYKVDNDTLNAMEDLLLRYNESRNNGEGAWEGKGLEEYTCRKCLFLDKFKCVDHGSCYNLSKLLCAYYGPYLGCNDPMQMYDPLVKFANATYHLDSLVKEVKSLIHTLSKQGLNINTTNKLTEDIKEMMRYSQDIDSSIFRMPLKDEECKDCYAICPPLRQDRKALQQLEGLAEELKNIAEKKAAFVASAGVIVNQTRARVEYAEIKETQNNWRAVLDHVKANYTALLIYQQRNMSGIVDPVLQNLTNTTHQCLEKVEKDIDMLNFQNISAKIAKCANYTKQIKKRIHYLEGLEGNITQAKEEAWKKYYNLVLAANSPSYTSVLKGLENKLNKLKNSSDNDVLSWESDLTTLADIKQQEDNLLQSALNYKEVNFIDEYALNVVKGYKQLMEEVKKITGLDTSAVIKHFPVVISLSLFALFFGGFMIALLFFWSRGGSALITYVLFVLAVLTTLSLPLLTWIEFSHLPEKMNFQVYKALLGTQSHVNIVIGQDDPTIVDCAKHLGSLLSGKGTEVAYYIKEGQICTTIIGKPVLCPEEDGTIYLYPSENISVSYYGPYKTYAVIEAPERFYQLCALDILAQSKG